MISPMWNGRLATSRATSPVSSEVTSMGYYILDSHEVGPRGKLALVEAIPGAVEAEFTPTEWDWRDRSTYPVYWVDNGTFQAVGIAIDKKELDRFTTGMNG